MGSGSFRFERFSLDPEDRQLSRDGAPVALNGRYLDALALLVREHGRLVTKDRFMAEVWRGVPVTDEALTQCVRTLRRQLEDEAANPRFIETVPKHGYRFVAPVEWRANEAASPVAADRRRLGRIIAAGAVGGGAAGVCGGIFYGSAAIAQAPGAGALSMLLVLSCVNILVGLLGGAGVAAGVAWAGQAADVRRPWCVIGGALGGLFTGGLVKLVGLDAFGLLFGRSPGDITGALEGALLGAAIGFGAWVAARSPRPRRLRRGAGAAALATGVAGLAIPSLGGRLMGGSLDQLAGAFPGSSLRLDGLGALFGETGFGLVAQTATGALEGLLFGGSVAAAMILAGWPSRTAEPPL